MKMSTKGRYGLRICLELAMRHGQGPVMVDSIAGSQGISANYIHLLAGALKAAGLVKSTRGPSGGYELARDPSRITALDAIRAVEGNPSPVGCVDCETTCDRSNRCVTRSIWIEVASAMEETLGRYDFEELARRQRDLERHGSMYEI